MQNSVNESQKHVILIHGMWMNAFSMRFIGNRLTKKGWQVIYYDYSSMFGSFDRNVDGLYKLWRSYRSENLHLVGHSLGGLLILAMMAKYQLRGIPRTVLMGCPVKGSAVAKKMMGSRWGKPALGKSIEALIAGDGNTLNNEIGIISGNKGIGIGHMIQKLPKPHDGVVAIEETEMDSASDAVTLPVTHATMLFSKDIANLIEHYLSKGRFHSG